ncbi:uncharacterized protein YbjT (DUF2867 family) [Nocardiopsis mwathae]|uniref:Uncharacterized protein YbjT (DUF2867 family) n=1 Tax=Nocardiopsis mwathae TaxID=1472723 RepID=A0A7X0D3T8_9ACTN|nr:uncharacterized protein YbjT (DUF2867 family) [Nocardiopsis mwathae]
MADQHTILVTGATGNVGREVVRGLLEPGAVGPGTTVRALVRGSDGADLPGGVEVVRGDLSDPESLRAALDGADDADGASVFLV